MVAETVALAEGFALHAGLRRCALPDIRIPQNLVPVFEAVSTDTGIPVGILASVIRMQLGGFPNTLMPGQIIEVGRALRDRAGPRGGDFLRDPSAPDWLDVPTAVDWVAVATAVFGKGSPRWRQRFEEIWGPPELDDKDRWVYDSINPFPGESFKTPVLGAGIGGQRVVVDSERPPLGLSEDAVWRLFQAIVGRKPDDAEVRAYTGMRADAAEHILSATGEAREWRVLEGRVREVRRWADSLYAEYLGRAPTNEEATEITQRGHTPQSLERYLAERPYGGTTIGAYREVRRLAEQYARREMGRAPDEGELNFMLTSGITSPESVSAFYEQMRQRRETGDPAFAWAADPVAWRARQRDLQSVWRSLGLQGEVGPQLVNRAASENWSEDVAREAIGALPAPNYPEGWTVGEVNRVRAVAKPWKTHYFPGEDVTREEVLQFRGVGPEAVRVYYRSLPANMAQVLPWRRETATATAKPAEAARPVGGTQAP